MVDAEIVTVTALDGFRVRGETMCHIGHSGDKAIPDVPPFTFVIRPAIPRKPTKTQVLDWNIPVPGHPYL